MKDEYSSVRKEFFSQARAHAPISRRTFIATSILAGGAVVVTSIPVIKTIVLPSLHKGVGKWIDFGSIDALEVGDFSMLSYEFMFRDGWVDLPQRGFVWATVDPNQSIRVYSSTCSHLACNVIWNKDKGMFECPCHSGLFNAQGQPVAGPPKKPLQLLPNTIENGNLSVEITI